MGVPLFQIRKDIEKHRIRVFSSNYTLYGVMSARVMNSIDGFSPDVEHYSIDEAFAKLEINRYAKPLFDVGSEIKETVRRQTGIPTSIGIAKTKTLAKIAGDIAKKLPSGVFDLTDERLCADVLEKTDIIDIWGINIRTAKKLHKRGVYTASQLRDMDIRTVRKELTVVGSRLVEELRGRPCLPLELVTPRKKSICCSRSFAGEVKTLGELSESIINYLSTAAEKLRKARLIASAMNLFIETNQFKEKGLYANSVTIKMHPTDSTRELISHAMRMLDRIYKPGFGYRKSGVILLELHPIVGESRRLFSDESYLRDRALMEALDGLNERYGRHTIRFGFGAKTHRQWKMARNHLSSCYTTDIHEILKVALS